MLTSAPFPSFPPHKAGEELLDDYGTYEYPQWLAGLFDAHQVATDYFVVKDRIR